MDRFITNYDRFYNEIKTIAPDFKEAEKKLTSEEKLNSFVRNWYPHMDHVSNGDLVSFQTKNIDPELFLNLNFLTVMKKASEENKNIVWEYLHTLYALSINIDAVKKNYLVENAKDEKELFTTIQTTISAFPNLIGNMVSWKRDKKKQLPKADTKAKMPKLDEKFMENSALAKLAKEISEEINPEEMLSMGEEFKNMDNPMKLFQSLMSGDNEKGVGKLLKSVSGKLKSKMDSGEIDQEELLKEATTIMQSMMGGMAASGAGGAGGPDLSNLMNMFGGMAAPDAGGGGSDLTNLMNMAESFSAMGGLFGEQPGNSRKKSRKMKRRIKKHMKKRK